MNPQYCRLVDRPASELIGLQAEDALLEVFDPDAVELLRGHRLRLMAGEIPQACYKIRVRYRGSETRWFKISAGVIQGSGGERRVVAQLLDISGEVRARREIEESEEKYRALVESAPVGTQVYPEEAQGKKRPNQRQGAGGGQVQADLGQTVHLHLQRGEARAPPPSTSTTAKLRKQKMKISAPAARRAGLNWGRVTRKNSFAPCAPRLRAASSVEMGRRLQSEPTMRAAIGKL